MNLGKRIKYFREKNNMTQTKLAKELNLSFQSISKWENDLAEPSLDYVVKMSKVFGVSLDCFILGEGSNYDKCMKFFKDISTNKYDQRTLDNKIYTFLEKNLPEPKGDPTWENGARGLLRGIIELILREKKQLNFDTIYETLLMGKEAQERQQTLLDIFSKQPLYISKNVVQALDCHPNTFRAYLGVLGADLDFLANNL